METHSPSLTSLVTAFARAYHSAHDTPQIFNDYLAADLFSPDEQAFFSARLAQLLPAINPELAAAHPDQATALALVMQMQTAPATLSRARYTEDALVKPIEQGVQQYVILGAGLDTFAFCHPELLPQLAVFEVDHPATQADKLQRIARAGWQVPPQLHFIAADFTQTALADALGRSNYDPAKFTFFSWMGVTYYLEADVVFTMLRSMAQLAPTGSSIVFDYHDTGAMQVDTAAKSTQLTQQITRRIGEPMQTALDPATLAAQLASLGLRLCEDIGPEEIEARYFAGRTDVYHAPAHTHFAWWQVK